jgi:polyisoprenoid-binding protein YceI
VKYGILDKKENARMQAAVRCLVLSILIAVLVRTSPAAGDPPDTSASTNSLRFEIQNPNGRNNVTFYSNAPLEDITGTSSEMSGYILYDPDNPHERAHGTITVPVASLNTGIPLRDEHLRSRDWLHADKFREITLEIQAIRKLTEVKSGDGFMTYDLVVVGDLSIHGKTRRMEVPGRLTYLEGSSRSQAATAGDLLAVRAEFEVVLEDFEISGPRGRGIIGSKVGDTIRVEVNFRAANTAVESTFESFLD